MSFKVKDLAMNVGVNEASTCSTWTRMTGGNSGNSCAISAFWADGGGGRNLAALKSQLRQAVARA